MSQSSRITHRFWDFIHIRINASRMYWSKPCLWKLVTASEG